MTDTAINSIIDNLCSKLGVGIESLIPAMQKYGIASGKVSIAIGVFIMVVYAVFAVVLYNMAEDKETGLMLCGIVFIFASMISITLIAFGMYSCIMWSNAPEGMLVNYIRDMVTESR